VYRNISDLDKILSYSEQEHVKGGRVRLTNLNLAGAVDVLMFHI
jgi:nitrite reductase (NAD(P)H)